METLVHALLECPAVRPAVVWLAGVVGAIFGFGNVTESEEELAPARAEGTNARGSPRREREKPQGHMKDKWCRWL